MSALVWDQTGKHFFETGVDKGVLYVQETSNDSTVWVGYAWNGLTGVTESPSGAEDTSLWADNIKYLTLKSAEEFGLTLTCYTYPDQWLLCDGSAQPTTGLVLGQQKRDKFGLCYRTKVGNDEKGNDYGYKLHIVYGCSATPSERAYSTVNDSPEAIEFSYEISTTPVNVNSSYAPTSLITVDSKKVDATKLGTLEGILYGTENTSATLPTPATVISTLS